MTYPLVIWHPGRWRTLFVIILVQQAIGLGGQQLGMLATLPAGHDSLTTTDRRFAASDGVGLLVMAAAFGLLCTWRSAGLSEARAE